MANNRMYLNCTGCHIDPWYMGKRMQEGYYTGTAPKKTLDDWFDEHAHCGGTHDHFIIEYQHPENYDMGGLIALLEEKLKVSS